MERKFLTVKETSEYLNIPLSSVYILVKSKEFPSLKIGKSWRVSKDQLDKWVLNEINNKPINYID